MNKSERELEVFLMENPKLIPFQRRLERDMNEQQGLDRLAVLTRYIKDNLDELSTELRLLQLEIIKITE
jgi:hypothetical protein